MNNLREKRRIKRATAIVTAAEAEFRLAGFAASRVDAIAARAEVSPATIYNYYGDKAALLLEVFRRHSAVTRTIVSKLIRCPPSDPIVAIDRYFTTIFDRSMRNLSPALWREAYAESYAGPPARFGGVVRAFDDAVYEEMRELFEALQRTGTVKVPISSEDLAELGLSVGNLHWSLFLTGKTSLASAKEDATRQISILLGDVSMGPNKKSDGNDAVATKTRS
ncbi:TetR/AcrR family transcriptional regulator [Phyllobacterium zundukense]|uniref:HTH tetR-type domain-containing protein n=1 Tax=Phyllobacterium zundukense TaxID=1867719 RepID=A0A2N9W0L6_9HYPH|nr:TetR/AcrR family transcriptional regulator [Phyllobacterium zundukense]ATU95468.1 hypothetical protein BLM14_27700 [Phyllobacterium zundukense]PIO45284.1 hypothetical protein B5P45_08485 [Phyllobacterium zundukense]